MDIKDRSGLKAYAAGRLAEQSFPPRRLALIHAGLIFLALMAVTGINYYVNHMMNGAVGLSGMGMLSVLETVQTVLGYAINILLPFWQMGFVFAALRMARGEQVRPASLKEGFRRFGPVLRLLLLRGLVYGGLAVACVYLGMVIFMLTPLAQPLIEMMLPIAESGESMEQMQQLIWQLPEEQITAAVAPAFAVVIPVCLLFLLPVYYRFRLSDLIIMDKPGTGALAALILSGAMSRKRRLALLRLDLSFWWYYLLQLAGVLLCNLDLLPLNVEVPWAASYALGSAVQMIAFWYGGSYFHTAWAAAYDQLAQQPVQMPKPRPDPKKLPWDEYNK